MTVATVVTRGYGSFGSIGNVVTRGYIDEGAVVASLSGTALAGLTEAQIVAGGETIIITVANDTWVTAGATFNAQRQNIINGLTSAQSEALGWNNEVRDNEVITSVVRTSDTVVTITLSAAPNYDVTSDESITVTIPATALTGGNAIVASPAVSVAADVVEETQKGGITRRRRYLVEIDGQFFDADNIAGIEAMLRLAEETAEESAQRDIVNKPSKKIRIKPPKIKVKTASGERPTSATINRQVSKTQRRINKIYLDAQRKVDEIREISVLMTKKIEKEERQDEDDILMLLL